MYQSVVFFQENHPTVVVGGKSAVLSAITVALGGKANSTGRGNGLKSFIREGQRSACLSMHNRTI